MNEMNELPSLWDGWVHQAFYTRDDGQGGNCALGWVDRRFGTNDHYADFDREILQVYRRVHQRILEMFPKMTEVHVPPSHPAYPHCVIAAANNFHDLTPEDFRRIDRETQMEEIAKLVDSSVEQPTTINDPTMVAAIEEVVLIGK